jgi:hypothetical protein
MPAINTAGLPANLKDYFQDVKPGFITNHLVTEMPTWLSVEEGVVDRLVLSNANVSTDMLQPGGKDAFNPKNDMITLSQRTLYTRAIKVDLRWTPSEQEALLKSYIQAMRKRIAFGENEVPFGEWFEPMILAGIKNAFLRGALMQGVYNASNTGTVDTIDGFSTIAKKNASTGTPNPGLPNGNKLDSPAGGMTQATGVVEFEKFIDLVPASDLIARDWALLADPQLVKFYNRDYRETFGANTTNTEFNKITMDGAQTVEIIPTIGLQGSGEMLLFPKPDGEVQGLMGPARLGVDNESFMETIKIETAERNIKLMCDFKAGVEFADIRQVYQYRKTPA